MIKEKTPRVMILGAGITGLAISYYLKRAGIPSIIYEKAQQSGGLCKSFAIDGYWFDYGGHCSFTKDDNVRGVLETGTSYKTSVSGAANYKKGVWIKHPVQNNLCVLDIDEKIRIIENFIERDTSLDVKNYADWLKKQYGTYFSENYPYLYTRKYWTVEPEMLETKWVGVRMYTPDIEEILRGAFTKETPCVHYSGEIRYPKNGGFGEFLKNLEDNAIIKCNKTVKQVDAQKKQVVFEDGECAEYDLLISTIPLPELISMMEKVPQIVREKAEHLNCTSLVLVSLGLNKPDIPPADAFYIYDEDILPARVYSTSVFGEDNVPQNGSTLQAEVYYSKFRKMNKSLEEIKEIVIKQLIQMRVFKEEDLVTSDVRFEKYANIIFTPDIYENRNAVHAYLDEQQVYYAGRFADWDYMWTDQSFLSGKKLAEKLAKQILGE